MHFLLILAILAALAIAQDCPAEPVPAVGYRLLAATLGVAFVALFARVSSGLVASRLRRDSGRRNVLLRVLRNLRRLHAALWLGVGLGILYWLDWAQVVRFNWHLDRAILVDDVLILAPILLPMVLSWAAFYEVDRTIGWGVAGGEPLEPALPSRRVYVALHLRHYLGVLLMPVLGLLAVQDTARLLVPGVLETRYAPAVCVPPILAIFLLFPCLLRYVWQTSPLQAGPLRNRLEAAARRAGFRAREILVWHTHRMVVNAAVAGLVGRLRYVFLTDGLMARLTDEEVEAVFGHEMGHVRHRHLSLRVLAMLAPLSLCLLVEQAFPETTGRLQTWLSGRGLDVQVSLGLVMTAAMGVYVFFLFGAYSRLLEAQADLFASRVLPSAERARPGHVFVAALEKLAAVGGVDRRAFGWLHGSIAGRVDFIERAVEDPKVARHLQRRARWLGRLVISIVVSPLLYCLLFG